MLPDTFNAPIVRLTIAFISPTIPDASVSRLPSTYNLHPSPVLVPTR
jgi:hypothetical protein